MFTFSIVLQSATNPTIAYIVPGGTSNTIAYIVPGGTSNTIGYAIVNSQNISISGSYIMTNLSGAVGLTLNYGGE